ncbi:MAG: DDE-type integrase/transposase/recombinase [Candidatus Pacearchaeota archaeon]|nr:DDE-type integrase/transposase/recombinase [Candidatus Pacearchaeota archaeon]
MDKAICPHCKSEDVVKRGTFESQAHGKQQRYFCKSCNRKFIERTAFYRMRNTPDKITNAIDLFYRGVSTRQVQAHLGVFYPHNADHSNIYRWIVKYSKMISGFTDKLKLRVGREMQIDEVEYNRRKQADKKGIEKNWFIDTIDPDSRFMITSEFANSRGELGIKKVLYRARAKTGEQIKVITSDGYLLYPRVVKSIFGYHRFQRGELRHNVVNASRGEGFNIMIERMHNSIRQRTNPFRGFHGSVESAHAIMKGMEVYYNFIRKHLAINCCPYELATDLKLKEKNKWLELINLSYD